jgi:hypothetical protein
VPSAALRTSARSACWPGVSSSTGVATSSSNARPAATLPALPLMSRVWYFSMSQTTPRMWQPGIAL